jgi:DNA-binding transcriptional MerR regulator
VPITFDILTSRELTWSLDEFVEAVNRLLPEVLPNADSPSKQTLNGRLVRHYTTEGILPKPLKDGAQARYDTDHLVRVLTLRRLAADGFASNVAGAFLARHDREALARFLLGELQLDLGLASAVGSQPRPSLDHLSPAVRHRLAALRASAGLQPVQMMGEAHPPAAGHPLSPSASPYGVAEDPRVGGRFGDGGDGSAEEATYTRYPLIDGLELHVRSEFQDPATPAAAATLRDLIVERLERIFLERMMRR